MAAKKVCAVADCGKPARSKCLCSAHYRRLWRHGSPTAGATAHGAALIWLEDHLQHDGDGCLTWPYSTLSNGYACVRYDGRSQSAARVMCEKVNGPPPELWYEAAHSCGRGHLACIHPQHVSWKRPIDNRRDKVAHGTDGKGSRNPRAKLTEDQVRYIREMAGRCTQASLCKRFGISSSRISMIQSGQGWSHLA